MELKENWQIISADEIEDTGAEISSLTYFPEGWYNTTLPSTVLACLVKNGVYDDVFYGKTMDELPELWRQDWWYRTEFSAPEHSPGKQYILKFTGINYKADIYLNGKQIADTNEVAGAYRVYEFNVSDIIVPGQANALALKITPPRNVGYAGVELTFSYVDWNKYPVDNNAGIWNKVFLETHNAVSIKDIHVVSDVESLSQANLTVYAELVNHSDEKISGNLEGTIGAIRFSRRVELEAGEEVEITFDPESNEQLKIKDPKLWWPYELGEPYLHELIISYTIDRSVSDSKSKHFGIREFTGSWDEDGNWCAVLNGEKIFIRGAGYSWDLLIRNTKKRAETHVKYVKDMGLNTIRLEGKLGDEYLLNACDREGVLLMAGWCCCSHWEKWENWNEKDEEIAYASVESQIRILRTRPSLFVWLHGSDRPPPEEILHEYRNILTDLKWPNEDLTNAREDNPGVKMTGPYDYVPPVYWFEDTQRGGAFGFASEHGPGPAIPEIESLKKFIPTDHLYPVDDYWNYHAGGGAFRNLNRNYMPAIKGRYGEPADLEDFVKKSQVSSYEAQRALFEAYRVRKFTSTGVIQWMLNNAWPSIIWHLYDYYWKQGGGYWGTKKANESLAVIWEPHDGKISVINDTYESYPDCRVKASLFNLDLTEVWSDQATVTVDPNAVREAMIIPHVQGLSKTYFIKLELMDANGGNITTNLYWYSTSPDVMDYNDDHWCCPGQLEYADLTGLNNLPENGNVEILSALAIMSGNAESVTIQLKNTDAHALAFFIRIEVISGDEEQEILPIIYEDNFITLWPGEERIINASYKIADKGSEKTSVRIKGYNVSGKSIEVQY